ncbi:hypothetical protein [Phenylobacterium aquaticum]|uniref:hypothetical protein n=1 Tax=Phenylobacterium aquaticum TaxID=1763816 RepID=UPI0026EEE653|nr:hypothetical protein [Phenylobacterium aquaticum]
MSTAWELLLQHRAELIDQLQVARKRAEAPYIAELESTNRALEALRGVPRRGRRPAENEAVAEPSSFSPKPPAARGRQKRSLKEMVQIALKSQSGPVDIATLMQALEQRWNRTFQQSRVELELLRIQQERAVKTDTEDAWREPSAPPPARAHASSSMSQ